MAALLIGVFLLGHRLGATRTVAAVAPPRTPSETSAAVTQRNGAAVLPRDMSRSLVYFTYGPTADSPRASRAMGLLLSHFKSHKLEPLRQALAIFGKIVPVEGFGSEYGTEEWLCEYILASPQERQRLTDSNPDGARLVRYLNTNGINLLVQFLTQEYDRSMIYNRMAPPEHYVHVQMDPEKYKFILELLAFNSPVRSEWEHTDQILRVIGLKPGDTVADIGCGPGFYSFRFSRLVGDRGKVFAVELDQQDLDYIRSVTSYEKIGNIQTVRDTEESIGLKANSLDCAFMCSMYHMLYGFDRYATRKALINSIRRALKPNGRLVVVDNTPDVEGAPPYWGSGISRYLAAAQLQAFGFRVIQAVDVIPQRYVMVLRKQ